MKTKKQKRFIPFHSSGLIGRSFTMLFISAGYNVTLFDILPEQTESAKKDIWGQLEVLEKQGLLRGNLSREKQFELVTATQDLEECVRGAFFIQVCTFLLPLLQNIFKISSTSVMIYMPLDNCESFYRCHI